jgi:1,4-dihydroxy-6-naphthoate synthase
MDISLGFSSCPNDTFIFDALLHGKIDTEGLQFNPIIEDVERLNTRAKAGELDVTKLSFHAFAYLTEVYKLLNAGSALGFGVGPLLISKKNFSTPSDSNLRVGIPGEFTTANFLLRLAYPNLSNRVPMLFSDIESALLADEIDLGLIIHENRFTYEQKGLLKIADLGSFWEELSGSAIPLGGIVVHRRLSAEVQQKIDRVIRRSIAFAFEHPKSSFDFVRAHSQEMSEEVMYKHIDLYVNKYSLDLGELGVAAVEKLFWKAVEQKIIPAFAADFRVV